MSSAPPASISLQAICGWGSNVISYFPIFRKICCCYCCRTLLFTNIRMFSTPQNVVEMFLKTFQHSDSRKKRKLHGSEA